MLSIAMLVYAITREIEEMTLANVGALLRNTTGDFEVRLLINGGPVIALPQHPNLVPIYMAERSSIAQAYNLAFSGAVGDTLACVHNDVTVPPGWNEPMQAACRVGFAFPRVREDEQECLSRGVGTTQAGFPTGCCFMFPREVYDALMGFDEAFEGCHFEDTDLWMRGMDMGFRLARANVTVEHGRAKTRTVLPDAANAAFQRNRMIYADKHRRADGSVHIPTLQEQPT
jgi:hypothetical protein